MNRAGAGAGSITSICIAVVAGTIIAFDIGGGEDDDMGHPAAPWPSILELGISNSKYKSL